MQEERKAQVAGISLTNPDRVFYPDLGITKHDLALFYEEIADWILPHVVGRPLTVVRCPEGYGEECFYQKHVYEALPDAIHGVQIKEKDGEGTYIYVSNLSGLIGLVQMGTLEIHPWGSRVDDPERPDRLIFDLDPASDVEWKEVVKAARLLRDRLDALGLRSFLKTSGGKGLHVVAPLIRRSDWEEVRDFARAVAEDIAREEPKKYVATMAKAQRGGRIFIDYLRNSRGATNVAAYSTRARAGAPVSTPLAWDELSPRLSSQTYTFKNLQKRLSALKQDPWKDFSALRQSITKKMRSTLF